MSLRSSFLCDLDSVKSNASGGISSEDPMMKAIPYLLLRLIPFLPVSTTCGVARTDALGVAFSFE